MLNFALLVVLDELIATSPKFSAYAFLPIAIELLAFLCIKFLKPSATLFMPLL